MKTGARRAVVAGEKHEGVVGEFLPVQLRHQAAEAGVHLGDVGPIGGVAGVVAGIILFKTRIAGDRFVRFVVANVEEKRLGLVAPRAQPVNGLVGNDAGGITLERANGRAVADKVPRVAMIG